MTIPLSEEQREINIKGIKGLLEALEAMPDPYRSTTTFRRSTPDELAEARRAAEISRFRRPVRIEPGPEPSERQRHLVTLALLNRRLDAKLFTSVIDRKLSSGVDRKIATEILGFEQKEVKAATNDEVVDLCHNTCDFKPKVMQYSVICTVSKVRINIVSGVSFALQPRPFALYAFAQFVLLPAVKERRRLQILQ